ncbi:hypothetical protein BD311DRAFT_868203 [Dichomitus squalens]|uniref:Uncharacterized protein n=1 Tax=Dichomitus squalens TaxID=114155 RepID=A0A4Q9MCR6_9APHY|nr:hypothetical protein BD311DRAFT_868203 [Dichomitus squalens]
MDSVARGARREHPPSGASVEEKEAGDSITNVSSVSDSPASPSSYRGTAEPQAGPSSSALELVDPPAGRESDTDVDEEQGSNFGTSSEAHDWGNCGDSDDPPGRQTSSWETVKDDCEEFERDSKASGSQFADDNVNDPQPGDAFVVDKVLQLPSLQSLRP